MCTPYIESQKMVAMATFLRCRLSGYICILSADHSNPPSITNCLGAISHTKLVNNNFSTIIGCHGNDP